MTKSQDTSVQSLDTKRVEIASPTDRNDYLLLFYI